MCDAYMVQGATHQFGYFYSLLDAILSSTYAYRRAITSGIGAPAALFRKRHGR